MSSYKIEQRRLTYRGKQFHFVSYDGLTKPAKDETQAPAGWFLMRAGKRWAVMPQEVGEEEAALDIRLMAWIDENVFGVVAAVG
jgi:hypothetical protein